jgi:hypothetical protein
MDLSTLAFGAMITVLPLVGAGLLAAMIMLERPSGQLVPAASGAGRGRGNARARRSRRRA